MNEFWIEELEPGYYDLKFSKGLKSKRGVQSFWHLGTFKKMAEYLKPDMNHLDYACGPGTFIGMYTFGNSFGVDISENQIDYAKLNYGDKGKFDTLENFLNYKEKDSYDLITIMGLIEFISDEEILRLNEELLKMVRKGGKLVYTTPNFRGLMFFLEIALNFFGKVNYSDEHVNKFSRKKLKNLFYDSTKSYKIKNFINVSLFFSIFSHSVALKVENIVDKLFGSRFGSLMLIEINNV